MPFLFSTIFSFLNTILTFDSISYVFSLTGDDIISPAKLDNMTISFALKRLNHSLLLVMVWIMFRVFRLFDGLM